MRRYQIAIAAGSAAALGAIAATIWVGASVREDTVVAHPYEDGLLQDAERHGRAALGLTVSIPGQHEAGASPLAFALHDRAGQPLDEGTVTVELTRPDTSRGERSAPARAVGGGRWSADLAFPAPGPWDVRFDVVLGGRRVRLERRVAVRPACDLAAGPCTRELEGGGEVTLELSPRPIRTMAELAVRVRVREPPHPGPLPPALQGGEGSDSRERVRRSGDSPLPLAEPGGEGQGEGGGSPAVTVSFSMTGMPMGENRSKLSPAAPGTWEGKAVLVRCASGRRDWIADVELGAPGAPARAARFPLTLPEDAR